MSVKVNIGYQRAIQISTDPTKAYEYLADFERSILPNFPGLETLKKTQGLVYEWTFKEVGHSNYTIQIHFATEMKASPHSCIEFTPVPNVGNSELNGRWDISPAGQGSQLSFSVTMETDLPIPFFLKSVAKPLLEKELTNYFDKYVSNVEKALKQ